MTRILFCLHLPPPLHGASTVGLQVYNSNKLKSRYDCNYLDLTTSRNWFGIKFFTYTRLIKIIFRLIIKIIRFSPQIIYYTPTVTGKGLLKDFLILSVLSLFKTKKIILHLHNKGASEIKNHLLQVIIRKMLKEKIIITLSSKLIYDIEKFTNNNKIFTCWNGVDFQNDKSIEIKDYDFLFLSNLIVEKGILDFIDACALLKSTNSAFKAAIVGAEKDISISKLTGIIKRFGLEKNLFILGPKYRKEKEEIYKKSKIFVFPTYYHYECFPLVLLEAMSFSLPIITTDEGAITDIVQNEFNGFICEKRNPSNLHSKMYKLLNNPQLINDYGVNGKKRYLDRFTEDNFIKRFDSIIQKVLDHEKN